MQPRHLLRAAAYVLFQKDDKILLLLRQNTGWMDGMYGLPSGHLDAGEPITHAAIREVKEEVGVDVKSLNLVHVMHRNENENFEYLDFYFLADSWDGEFTNAEPMKCEKLEWFAPDNLPENIIPNVAAFLQNFRDKKLLSEFGSGWQV